MLFTSESVTEGHPDKMCDQIADAILDEIIKRNKDARVACEAFTTKGTVIVMGEVSEGALNGVDIDSIVRRTVRSIGYTNSKFGFDADGIAVINLMHTQSPDIARGVDNSLETRNQTEADIGAGDQGIVFGYASDETSRYIPMPIYLAHELTKQLAKVRKTGVIPYLGPDGKSQVTINYENELPLFVDTIVISAQHLPEISQDTIQRDIIEHVIRPVIPSKLLTNHTKIYINPTGRFVVGGPQGDTGLTGRKIIVDTYGGVARHGGGAFSGKDPTKVDRSAAYAARYVAKNIVAAGLAKKCEIQIAYAIGVAKPVSVSIDAFGTGKVSDDRILELIDQCFDLRPSAIINELDLKRPIYSATSVYGHFGRHDDMFPWERLDKVQALEKAYLTQCEVQLLNDVLCV